MKPLEEMTEPELREVIGGACEALKNALPPNTGFVFQAATFGGRIAQYGSNVERSDAEEWMLETLLRWKRRDYAPRVEFNDD